MKRALGVLLFAGVASAAPITPLTPPAGWQEDRSLATPPVAQRFGGATTKVDVWAYRAPASGAVLYVNRAQAELETGAARDRIATMELDELRNALRRQGETAQVEQDSQRFDSAKRQLDASLTWHDANVRDASRIVIAADATQMVAVTAQCVLAADAPAEIVRSCEAALATLDAGVPADTRVALSIVAAPEPPPKPTPDVLDDGSRSNLPAIRVEPTRPEPDRRPVYVGGGLVVLAAVFYWNRRRREKFEREHPLEAPPSKVDEDDLHAAAADAQTGDDKDRQ